MSSSPSDKKPNQPDIQFTTGNIGRWNSRQEDPFAKQNRERAAKTQAKNRKKRKAATIIAIIIGAILTIAAVVGLIFLIIHLAQREVAEAPEISGGTSEDISNYRDLLQEIYDRNPDATDEERAQAVQNAVDGTLGTQNGREHENAVKTAQIILLADNNLCREAVDLAPGISEDALDLDLKILYYNSMYACTNRLGLADLSSEYFLKLYNANEEQGGEGGGA